MASRIYDVSLGNNNNGGSSLIKGKSVTYGTLSVCLNTVLHTGMSNASNVSPGMTESCDLKLSSSSYGSTVKRNCIAVSALLVILNALVIAISRASGNVNSEAVNAGSSEAEGCIENDLNRGGYAGSGNVCKVDLVSNYVNGGLTNATVDSTGACGAAGRSGSNYSLGGIPSVSKRTGSVNDNLLLAVRAVLALYDCKTGLVAVGLRNDLNNVTVARLTGSCSDGLAIITKLAPLLVCRDSILALKAGLSIVLDSRGAVSVLVIKRLDNLGYVCAVKSSLLGKVRRIDSLLVAAASVGANALHNAVSSTSGLGDNSPLAPSVLTVAYFSPVGNNGSLTSFTLVKIITEGTALRSNGLDELNRSIRHSVRFIRAGTDNVCMNVRCSLCENGNNAAYAHNNGEQKSKNSFRIVLH
jgi:hypothetical protein